MPSLVSLGVFAGACTLAFPYLRTVVADRVTFGHGPAAGWVLLVALVAFAYLRWSEDVKSFARFAWACFLAPLGKESGQKVRLERFYRSQAQGPSPSPNRGEEC